MQNVSPSRTRPARHRAPSRIPHRGLAALVLTGAATALLFSFQTPSDFLSDGTAQALGSGAA